MFFMTARDPEIIGRSSDRDLLGLQPLWSFYGNRLVPHLTSRSVNAHHLSASLLFGHIYECYAREQSSERLSRVQAVMVLEQVYAYAHFAAEDLETEENFPGVRLARGKWLKKEQQALQVGPATEYHLLSGQSSQGLFARYSTPLRHMKLIKRHRPEVNWPENDIPERIFGSDVSVITERMVKLLSRFNTKTQAVEIEEIYGNKDNLPELMLKATGNDGFSEGQKRFWTQQLGIEKDSLLKHIADSNETDSVKDVLTTLINEGVDKDDRLKSVIDCESYLSPMAKIFWLLTALSSLNQAEEILIDNEPDFETKFGKAQENFRSLPRPKGQASRRWDVLGKLPVKPEGFLQELVGYHNKEQGKQAVLTMGAGKKIETTRPDWLEEEPQLENAFTEWGRNYYVGSLWSIVSGLKEASG